ncbi:MAG: helix-turn-helix domain-containing protein [Dermatophilaceae bacterium]
MSRTVIASAAQERSAPAPVIAEVGVVRLLWHARELRGTRSLREAAALVGMNRDELGRIERGETKQIHFQTLAKILAAYRCTLDDLLEVDVAPAHGPTPLYAGAVAALAAGPLPADAPMRRTVRRSTTTDVVNEGDEDFFAVSTQAAQVPAGRRRSPMGTLNR